MVCLHLNLKMLRHVSLFVSDIIVTRRYLEVDRYLFMLLFCNVTFFLSTYWLYINNKNPVCCLTLYFKMPYIQNIFMCILFNKKPLISEFLSLYSCIWRPISFIIPVHYLQIPYTALLQTFTLPTATILKINQ